MIFDNTHVYNDLQEIIDKAHKNELSIATFKPSKVSELVIEEVEREWSQKKLMELELKAVSTLCFKRMKSKVNFRLSKNYPINSRIKLRTYVGNKAR